MASDFGQTRPQFISFEGTEGVGKTTAITALCERLETAGIAVVRTREPGGSDFAERCRSLLLDPDTSINDDSELLLMFAARCDHVSQVILPGLKAGKWVVCDRFVDSSIAYQGFGRRHGDAKMLAKIERLTQDFVPHLPDVTFWLDLPIAEGMARAGKRSRADRFEQEQFEFFARVYQGYESLYEHERSRFCRIDARGSAEQVADKIWQALIARLA